MGSDREGEAKLLGFHLVGQSQLNSDVTRYRQRSHLAVIVLSLRTRILAHAAMLTT